MVNKYHKKITLNKFSHFSQKGNTIYSACSNIQKLYLNYVSSMGKLLTSQKFLQGFYIFSPFFGNVANFDWKTFFGQFAEKTTFLLFQKIHRFLC